mmetsp:Transcript_9154/g.37736  ORF Transcript_9154/g.37736 Transcript_9154/m.37736 type:complete len:515 (+) Transcript_9154:1510-3054(+)
MGLLELQSVLELCLLVGEVKRARHLLAYDAEMVLLEVAHLLYSPGEALEDARLHLVNGRRQCVDILLLPPRHCRRELLHLPLRLLLLLRKCLELSVDSGNLLLCELEVNVGELQPRLNACPLCLQLLLPRLGVEVAVDLRHLCNEGIPPLLQLLQVLLLPFLRAHFHAAADAARHHARLVDHHAVNSDNLEPLLARPEGECLGLREALAHHSVAACVDHRLLHRHVELHHVQHQLHAVVDLAELLVHRLHADRVEGYERGRAEALLLHVHDALLRSLLVVHNDGVEVAAQCHAHRQLIAGSGLAEVQETATDVGKEAHQAVQRLAEALLTLGLAVVCPSLSELRLDLCDLGLQLHLLGGVLGARSEQLARLLVELGELLLVCGLELLELLDAALELGLLIVGLAAPALQLGDLVGESVECLAVETLLALELLQALVLCSSLLDHVLLALVILCKLHRRHLDAHALVHARLEVLLLLLQYGQLQLQVLHCLRLLLELLLGFLEVAGGCGDALLCM